MRRQTFGLVVLLQVAHVLPCVAQIADPGEGRDLSPALVLEHGGSFRPKELGGRDLILLSLAFSPDGKTIASAGGGQPSGLKSPAAQGEVKLWDVSSGKLQRTISVENGIVFQVNFSPDGKWLAAASGSGAANSAPGEIRLFNPTTGQLVRKLLAHRRGAYGVAFSPDGRRLATSGLAEIAPNEQALGEIKLWNLETGEELWTGGGHTGSVGSLAFSDDGKTLASAGSLHDGRVKLWDVATGTDWGTLGMPSEVAEVVAFVPKTSILIVLTASTVHEDRVPLTVEVSRWDLALRKRIESTSIKNGNAYRMTLSHRQDLLACTCHDGVKVYEVANQALFCSLPSKLRMRPVAFSPNDEWLASACDDGTVKLWKVALLRK